VPQPLSSAWACCVQARTKAPLPNVGGCLDRGGVGPGKGRGGAGLPGRGGAGKGGGGGGAGPRGAAARNGHPGGGKPAGVGKPPGKPGGGLASQMAQQKPCAAMLTVAILAMATASQQKPRAVCALLAPCMHTSRCMHAAHEATKLRMHMHMSSLVAGSCCSQIAAKVVTSLSPPPRLRKVPPILWLYLLWLTN
jgi:hypothetical protein